MHVDQHELDQLNVALALSAAEAVAETQAATLLESAPQPQPTGTSDPDVAPLASSATDVQPPQGSPATGAPPVVGNAGASVADAQLGTQLVVASTGAAVAAAPAPAQVVPVEEDVNITVKCAICNLEALCAKSKVLFARRRRLGRHRKVAVRAVPARRPCSGPQNWLYPVFTGYAGRASRDVLPCCPPAETRPNQEALLAFGGGGRHPGAAVRGGGRLPPAEEVGSGFGY